MMIGLDLGASEFRSLYHAGDRLQLRRMRAVYATVEDTTPRRKLLQQAAIPFAVCQEHLVVVGTAAEELSHLLRVELRPLLPEGRIPQADPLGRQLLVAGIEAAVPVATESALCCWSCAGVEAGPEAESSQGFVEQVLRLRGYSSQRITAGEALLLAELGRDGFSGLSLSFGASHCSATLSLQGQTVWSHSLARGGDWLDEQMARFTERTVWDAEGRQLLDVAGVRSWREGLLPGGKSLETPEFGLLQELCGELLSQLLRECAVHLAAGPVTHDMRQNVCLLAGGGLTQIPGWRRWLEAHLSQYQWPLKFNDVRIGSTAPETVSRGCLIRANLEATSPQIRAA